MENSAHSFTEGIESPKKNSILEKIRETIPQSVKDEVDKHFMETLETKQPDKPDFQKLAVDLRNKVTGKTYVSVFGIADILELFWNEEVKPLGELKEYFHQQGSNLKKENERLIALNERLIKDKSIIDSELTFSVDHRRILREQIASKDAELAEAKANFEEIKAAIVKSDTLHAKLKFDMELSPLDKANLELAKCYKEYNAMSEIVVEKGKELIECAEQEQKYLDVIQASSETIAELREALKARVDIAPVVGGLWTFSIRTKSIYSNENFKTSDEALTAALESLLKQEQTRPIPPKPRKRNYGDDFHDTL